MSNLLLRKDVETLEKMQLFDFDEELELFSYTNCNKDDCETLKRARGIVFNKEQLVSISFPYCYEYTNNDTVENIPIENCRIYDSYEGTIIRIFYFKKWYITTNKKLNAFKSKWSSLSSYGYNFLLALLHEAEINTNFKERLTKETTVINKYNIIELFLNILDTSKQYMFLLPNSNDNRIVCKRNDVNLFHIGTFDNFDFKFSLDDNINLPKPTEHYFQSFAEILEYVSSVDYYNIQGLIIFTSDFNQHKIYNDVYYTLYNLRGNVPSIKYRYLELRNDEEKIQLFKDLYPEKTKDFEAYEQIISDITNVIFDSYCKRYKYKEYIRVSPQYFNIMKTAHNWHIQDRDQNKVSYNKISDVLNNQEPRVLNYLIKQVKYGNKYIREPQVSNPVDPVVT